MPFPDAYGMCWTVYRLALVDHLTAQKVTVN